MNTLISLIMIVSDINNIDFVLKNIINQSFTNWELFVVLESKDLNTIDSSYDIRITIIEKRKNSTLLDFLYSFFSNLKGDLICILNSEDISHPKRLEKQSLFMHQNKHLSICSCLSLAISTESNLNNSYNESNSFITAEEIDFAALSGYISLDIYTFMIRKDFLILINKPLFNHTLDNNLDFILYFLQYTYIEKLPEILYYFKDSRVPYKESIIMDNTLNSQNKISIFNKNRSIESRNYLNEALIKNKIIPISNITVKYNILVIIDNLNIGGTETYILTLSQSLRNFGICTYILTSGGILQDVFTQTGITVLKVKLYPSITTPKSSESIINYIGEILRKYNIKLIQLHSSTDIHLCYDLKKISNIPIVLTLHGTFYSKILIEKYLIYISMIIFVSPEVEKFYSSSLLNNKKISSCLIPNAIEDCIIPKSSNFFHNLLDLPINSKILLYCSRLSFGKAPAAITFLKSFEKIAFNDANLYAVIIGDGDNKILVDSYSKTINSSYKTTRIYVLGSVFNVNDYYSDSLFVVGTGRVALEAMSCAKPIISLGLNGLINLVNKNNISTMLYTNFGDHTSKVNAKTLGEYSEKLTHIMTHLINNPTECEHLGLWSKAYCKDNLNLISTTQYIIKVFDDILNNNNK